MQKNTQTTTSRIAFALAIALLLALIACDQPRQVQQTQPGAGGAASCTACHGDATRSEASALLQAAPPRSATGADAGAHLRHLHGGTFRAAIACNECHPVPASVPHSNGKVDLVFGPLASSGSAQPVFAAGSCSSVYCHGATLGAGGTQTTPSWTGTIQGCTSCHGYPPTSHQASQTSCASCHPGTVNADGTLNLAGGLHINGQVDVQNAHAAGWADPAQHGLAANADLAQCKQCHGTDLAGGNTGVSCDTCHTSAGFATWRTNCTFCHGTQVATYTAADLQKAAPPKGTQGETAITTRAVGAHQAHVVAGALGPALACIECHATLPTDLSHVDGTVAVAFGAGAKRGGATPAWNGTSCATTYCHGATLTTGGGANKAPVWTGGSAQAACGTCHGAPPPPPHSTSTACGSCHAGYTATTVNLATHIDGVVQVTSAHAAGWADKAQHGYSVNASGLTSCKSCHGTNLDGVGGTGPSCASCHTSAGITSWQTSCTFCHGDRTTGRASPPVDTQGRSVTTNVSVGVHDSHLGTTLMTGMACTQCHPDRTGSNVITDAAHIDGNGVAEVTFGSLARTGGAAATYTRTSATAASCSSTYCHGSFTGGASATMSWTSTTQATCTSCHGAPPSLGADGHHSFRACSDCHPGYTSSSVTAATHLNGAVDVGNQITSYSTSTHTCTNSCHSSRTWY